MAGPDPAELDAQDAFTGFRNDFWIPSKTELNDAHILSRQDGEKKDSKDDESATYLCGNSLGLQPKAATSYVTAQLDLWRSKGVYGHFKATNSLIPPWVNIDEAVQKPMARVVGALPSEVAVMQTLSANLHLLLSCFYKPTSTRYKIILEAKSFPSDHFVVESQLRHHRIEPTDGMVLLQPPSASFPCFSTGQILDTITAHASSTALILLPGIQFYTGQFFDISQITAHAHSHDIIIGWDLAHAVGNVPLSLHDWQVDFAAWCNYKYMNAGPGAIGSLFVHSRHTDVPPRLTVAGQSGLAGAETENPAQRPRLHGWWGSTKASRFTMDNVFEAMPGAAGFQLSNPSVLDISALMGSLSVFDKTSVDELRAKSVRLTKYLEDLLLASQQGYHGSASEGDLYSIITPLDPAQRGAQLSIRLSPDILNAVMKELEERNVAVDERKPDVIRVAPAPLYNTFSDCKRFADVFTEACKQAEASSRKAQH